MFKCVICNGAGIIKHHTDYEKDIKVDVCRSCHPRIHACGLEELVMKGNYSEVHNLIKKITSRSIMVRIKNYAYEELRKVTDCELSDAICEIINRNEYLKKENEELKQENKKLRIDM